MSKIEIGEEEETTEVKPYEYYEQILVKKVQHFYLSGIIEAPTAYVDMIHKINTATPDDVIYLHLNTQGGDLSTGIQLINAMKCSPAHIICSLEGEAYSLGSMIFLAGDEFLTHENSIMMIHNFSGGIYGKGNEQVSQLEATIKWFHALAKKYYIPFLSETELDGILKGEDLWLQADDVRKRLNKMIKIMQKEQKEAEKKANKSG
jgi:ATP-dependent protease ClpP protease subunit